MEGMKMFHWPWQKKIKRVVRVGTKDHVRELIRVGRTVRVENGPARKTAVATKKLLSDAVTAPHYQEGAPDAMGKKIVLGQVMTYLDYLSPWIWYVYKWDEAQGRWLGRGFEGAKENALKLAEAVKED